MQTILTGSISLVLLFIYGTSGSLWIKPLQWLLVFLSLFWLRQLFNFALIVAQVPTTGKYPDNSDEVTLATMFHLPPLSISLLTAVIAAAILVIVLWKYVPCHQRFTFVCAGFCGGLSGFYLWFELIGPTVLP